MKLKKKKIFPGVICNRSVLWERWRHFAQTEIINLGGDVNLKAHTRRWTALKIGLRCKFFLCSPPKGAPSLVFSPSFLSRFETHLWVLTAATKRGSMQRRKLFAECVNLTNVMRVFESYHKVRGSGHLCENTQKDALTKVYSSIIFQR